MTINNRFRDAISKSVELEKRGEHAPAVELSDEAIAGAIRDGDVRWIRTLCHHAQSCPDLLKIGRQLNAITNNPSPRILKMPEHCMGWQPSLSMRVTP